MTVCEWCNRISDSGERWECYLIDDDGNTSSVVDHVVQTIIAQYCPWCGSPLQKSYSDNTVQEQIMEVEE